MSEVSLTDVIQECHQCAALQRGLDAFWEALERFYSVQVVATLTDKSEAARDGPEGVVKRLQLVCSHCANTRMELTPAGAAVAELLLNRDGRAAVAKLGPEAKDVVERWTAQRSGEQIPF